MKILAAQQLSNLDDFTIAQKKISSTELMYTAANKCFDWIQNKFNQYNSFCVVCGPGNNGGDGLVVSQLLHKSGFNVECLILDFTSSFSSDFKHYFEKLKSSGCSYTSVDSHQEIDSNYFDEKVIIDTIFGFGLSRSIEGLPARVIQQINASKSKAVLAVDLPSGLYCDKLNEAKDVILTADYTLTFHSPKLSFFLPETGNYAGQIEVLDIGLDKEYAESLDSNYSLINKETLKSIREKRPVFSHKGTYGHANIIAGSKGMMGAAVLSTRAAIVSGAGLTTATVPEIGLNVLQTLVPVAMCNVQYGKEELTQSIAIEDKYTYGIGPGLGTSKKTKATIADFIRNIKRPIVIDADALNCIAAHPELLKVVPENSILTPHIKEFDRLFGESENSLERIAKLSEYSQKYKVIIVLKDARTVIATPHGECFFSLYGNPGMATGGSGDVLTGLITGLLTQKYSPEAAAKMAVLMHGLAGDKAAEKYSQSAMTAEDIIEEIRN